MFEDDDKTNLKYSLCSAAHKGTNLFSHLMYLCSLKPVYLSAYVPEIYYLTVIILLMMS